MDLFLTTIRQCIHDALRVLFASPGYVQLLYYGVVEGWIKGTNGLRLERTADGGPRTVAGAQFLFVKKGAKLT